MMEVCYQGLVVAVLFATAALAAAVAIPGLDIRLIEPIQGPREHRRVVNREEPSELLCVRVASSPYAWKNNESPSLTLIASPPTNQFSCDPLVYGLSLEDCQYMSTIGMLGQGENAVEDNGQIWIGSDGPNIFTFINAANVPITLILWHTAMTDDQASFMNARMPKISYSLPTTGSAVQLSIANGVPGGWAAIYNRQTTLTQYGQVSNTFGEFSTGPYATIDVSRLVNMSGNPMTVRVSSGCVADMRSCVYMCDRTDNSCGAAGTYSLANCGGHNAVHSIGEDGNPTGGCQGWSYGGHVEVVMT
ncbi:hypothetical protein B0T22DRAFT_176686 [Podospora appendiculata]|uniref:Uncharacterized protein n=1 Tax=Podospora appendiculata TaxID=314037 RepID=A0AAE0XBS1_9PEZI|nr:hypothetical protein B0T22DRAFT_176686 [Podospora appendiculata]